MNPLGKFLRKYRIDENEMSLRDMASALGISSSLLSAYETGRRDIPDADAFYSSIIESFPMNGKNARKLRQAIDKSLESYRVDLSDVDPVVRDRYVEFARKIKTISIEDFEKLGLGDGEEE